MTSRTLTAACVASIVCLIGCGASKPPFRVTIFLSGARPPAEGSDVRVAGDRAGRVTRVTRFGTRTQVVVELEDRDPPLRVDTQAILHPQVLELTPGAASTQLLRDGATLPLRCVRDRCRPG